MCMCLCEINREKMQLYSRYNRKEILCWNMFLICEKQHYRLISLHRVPI